MKKTVFLLLILSFCLSQVYSQTSKDCECTALSYKDLIGLKKMSESEREDYLLDNCFQPGREKKSDEKLKFKEFTKCKLQTMGDDSYSFLQGDYSVKLWNDNSVQFTTYRVQAYRQIKKQIEANSSKRSRDNNIDYFTVNGKLVSCQATVNKSSTPTYIIIFTF